MGVSALIRTPRAVALIRANRTEAAVAGLILAMLATTLGLVALSGVNAPPLTGVALPWPLLLGAFVIGEATMVRLHFRSEAHEFNLIDAPLVFALFGATPAAVVSAGLVAVLLVRCARRQSPLKAAFNMGLVGVEISVAVVVVRLLSTPTATLAPSHWVAALLGIGLGSVCSAMLVNTVIALTEGEGSLSRTLRSLGPSLAIMAATVSLSLAATTVVAVDVRAGALLLGPMALVFLSYRAYVAKLAESGRLAFIARFTTDMASAGDAEESLRTLLRHVTAEMGARTAEVVIFAPTGARQLRLRARLDQGELTISPCLPAAALASVTAYLPAAGDGEILQDVPTAHPAAAYLAHAEIDDAVLVPLITEQGPFGILAIGNREGDVTRWREGDHALAVAVAQHTSAILRSADLQQALSAMSVERGRLLRESHQDPLTHLVNRRGLQRAIDRAAATCVPIAAVYIDLDDFKTVNDTHGHAVGDGLLRAIGLRLRGIARAGDVAARLGGDEFIVLLSPAPDEATTLDIAERVRRVIAEPVHVDGVLLSPGASVGIATGPVGTDAATLLERADAAMYRAKKARRSALRLPEGSVLG